MSKHKTEPPAAPPSEAAAPQAPEAAPAAAAESLPAAVPHRAHTPEEIEELTRKAERAQQWYDQLLRTTADFENFRKRAARERAEAARFANEGMLQKLVLVLDSFDMANAAAAGGANATVPALQTGMAMIRQQLGAVLTEAGVEEVEATGQPFDPNLHEAVAQEESADVAEGRVLRQLRKGYKLRERLLRPATVIVAKPPKPQEASLPEKA
jgi:molecular chaperone GrpE